MNAQKLRIVSSIGWSQKFNSVHKHKDLIISVRANNYQILIPKNLIPTILQSPSSSTVFSPPPLSQRKSFLRFHRRRRREDRAVRFAKTAIKTLPVLLRRETRESSTRREIRWRSRLNAVSLVVRQISEDRWGVVGGLGFESWKGFKSLRSEARFESDGGIVEGRRRRSGEGWHGVGVVCLFLRRRSTADKSFRANVFSAAWRPFAVVIIRNGKKSLTALIFRYRYLQVYFFIFLVYFKPNCWVMPNGLYFSILVLKNITFFIHRHWIK